MQLNNVSELLRPLLRSGQEWQYITINGSDKHKPKLYFSNIQLVILALSVILILKLKLGLSKELMGYIISAFSISVTLFMSLLVNIFDKFDKTNFNTQNASEDVVTRLIQKKNFFKKFISITIIVELLGHFP